MFHHLKQIDDKERTLREIRRVLKSGGRLALLDFAPPSPNQRGLLSHWMHSSDLLKDNAESRMLSLLDAAGFTDGQTVRRAKLAGIFRTAYYVATMPEEDNHA
jgi:ubiquinone/menaquinone biosynthesis C-methylase UbiE